MAGPGAIARGVRWGGEPVKTRSDFLLEVGCEEIPAGLLPGAIRDIQQILEKHFGELGLLAGASIRVVGAPRRIAVMVEDLLLRQADSVKEILGPPKSVGFDKVGAPTRAAESFAQKQNVSLEQISIITTPKGEYLAYKQKIVGRVTAEILSESLPQWIQELTFPRAMYWTSKNGPKFTRPIRWIVALLDDKVVPFTLGDVHSGNATSGHRFLGKRSIPLHGTADYLSTLRTNFVMADPAERRKRIESQLHSVPHAKKLQLHADAGLVDLTSYLNEYPTVIIGDFDPSYLELPDEILLTVMRDHQKYFGVEDKAGNLAPHFLAVINLENDAKNLVRAGHEKVLAARFADARFFWETDQKHTLAEYLPKLAAVTYESRLGTYGDKVERIRQIARWTAEHWFSSGTIRLTFPARTVPRSWRNAIWSLIWSGSLPNCRESWADYTRRCRENRNRCPQRCTITTGRWGLTIPSREISPGASYRWQIRLIRSWPATRLALSPQVQVIHSLCGERPWG
jgi:glycyl-tRNA synthetase beta chain